MKTSATLFYLSGVIKAALPSFIAPKLKAHLVALLLLLSFAGHAMAQKEDLSALPYISIVIDGRRAHEGDGEFDGTTLKLTSISGYLATQIYKMPGTASDKWYVRAYYHLIKDPAVVRTAENVDNLQGSSVYIAPGNELIFEVLDSKTDMLIRQYIVSRPKLEPIVNFYHKQKDSLNAFYTLRPGNHTEKLSMNPGTLDLKVSRNAHLKKHIVDYLLVNDRTKEQQVIRAPDGFITFDLEPRSVYRLVVSYSDQPESQTVAFLFVKPYWYKSTVAYINYALVVVGLMFFVVVRSFKLKIRTSQKEKQKFEQAAIRLRSQLNPHFTFNALSSIQGLMNTDRIEEANRYLEEFGSLLRATLVKSNEVFNNLEQELEMMRTYIRLEALRFNFQWEVKVSDDIDRSAIEIPTLLLQPLIENAIKHGLSSLGEAGHLLISCEEVAEKDSFAIIIKDNGAWLERQTGYGLSLTNDLIRAVNELKTNGRISLQIYKSIGTTVILTFHNWMNE